MRTVKESLTYLQGYRWNMLNINHIEECLKDPKCKGEKKEEYLRRLNHALDRKREIEDTIQRVPDDRLVMLLQLVYIEDLSLEMVADRMGLSYSHIAKLHRKAIASVVLPDSTR